MGEEQWNRVSFDVESSFEGKTFEEYLESLNPPKGELEHLFSISARSGNDFALSSGDRLDSSSVEFCSPSSTTIMEAAALVEPSTAGNSTQSTVERKRPRRGTATNRAALSARENRQKKKCYIESLEEQVKQLASRNKELEVVVTPLKASVERLESEVAYLRRVINNESAIAAVLKSVPNVEHMKFSSRQADAGTAPSRGNSSRGGVCLHVAGGSVNAVFCATCSDAA